MGAKRKRSAAATLPRPGRKVTVVDLERLQTCQTTHVLYCRRCHGTYSADPADYFSAKADRGFKCCHVNNILMRRTG